MRGKFDIKNIDEAQRLSCRLQHVQRVIAAYHPRKFRARVSVHPPAGSGLEALEIPLDDVLRFLQMEEKRLQRALRNMRAAPPAIAICRWKMKSSRVKWAQYFLSGIVRKGLALQSHVDLYLAIVDLKEDRPLSVEEEKAWNIIHSLFEKSRLYADCETELWEYIRNGNEIP